MTRIPEPILVTGAGGFIGRRLVEHLLNDGYRVDGMFLDAEPVPKTWKDRVGVIRADVRNGEDVLGAVRGHGTVFHLAALLTGGASFADHWAVTAEGSRNVYQAAAAENARVVVTTSICAYGDKIARETCREDEPRGEFQGAYGRAKQAQEDIADEIRKATDLDVRIVRPANVYGAGSGPWVELLGAGLLAGMIAVPGDGSGNAGLVHVENVVDALVLIAASEQARGRTYNVCDAMDISWRRYMDDLAAIVGAESPADVALETLLSAARANENPAQHEDQKDPGILSLEAINLIGSDNRFDTSRITSELGWTPRVSYQAALQEIKDAFTSR